MRSFPATRATRTRILVGSLSTLAAAVGLWIWQPWHATPSPGAPGAATSVTSAPPAAPTFRDAFVEIAVATSLSEEELAVWQDRRKLLSLLGTFAPGGPGEAGALRTAAEAMVRDDQASTFEVMSAERFILPPVDDAELVAPQLDAAQRARFFASTSVLVLRFRGSGGPPHHTARIGFGLAVSVAEQVGGILDDEVRRRVEMPAAVKARSVLPDVRSAFHDDSIVVELDPDEDSSTRGRLLGLGMKRYGAPDLELRDVEAHEAPALARFLTALCRIAAVRVLPESLTLTPADLFPDEPARAGGAPIQVRFTPAELATGNPDNELLSVSLDLSTRTRLARELGLVVPEDAGLHAESESEFEARLSRVRRELPGMLARWRQAGGALFVLVDFTSGAGPDAEVESMWVEARSLEARGRLQGTLANEPAHVLGTHYGDPVEVAQPVISGYRLELPSGERVAFP